jgi:hypothetical protein
MGDRFTFGVTARSGDVMYLYSHWGGDTWDADLKSAIWEASTHLRSIDYANRIIMSRLIGNHWDSNVGFGISINDVNDTDYAYVPVVDIRNNTVTFYEYNREDEMGETLFKLSIIEYMNTKDIFTMLQYALGDVDVTV